MLRFRQYFMYLSLGFRNFCFEGKDAYGNQYYRKIFSKKDEKNREKRIVIYQEGPEATNIPPEWYGWMHFITQESPSRSSPGAYKRSSPTWGTTIGKRQVFGASALESRNVTYVQWTPNGEIKKAHETI